MHTATFEINIPSNPLARCINLEDIEMGMDADTGVKARASRDSVTLTVIVHATDAADAAKWLRKAGLISPAPAEAAWPRDRGARSCRRG